MKKYISLILLLMLALVGCSNEKSVIDENNNTITDTQEKEKINSSIKGGNIENNTNTILEKDKNIEEKIEDTQNKKITISFVGDCTIGTYKGQGYEGTYNEYYDKYGGDYFLENVRDIFEKDDITFINLEGPITDRDTTVEKKFPISCRNEHINVINKASIEVCGLSNNHTMDCSINGFNDTINILEDSNIGYCGEGNIYRKTIDDINISCLAYNGWSASEDLLTKITNDITYEKENGANIICVMFHWGIERDNYSNEIQQKIAHHTIDSGADIVVGGHPHVIQGIEQYNGKTIIYSLGNFTFGANKNPSDKDTFIFQQTFEINNGETKYDEYNIIPCSISSVSNKNDYKPTPLYGEDKDKVLGRLLEYSKIYKETIFK